MKYLKRFNESNEIKLLYDIETRPYGSKNGQIYVAIFNEDYFLKGIDDHDVVYNVNNPSFHKEFKKAPFVKGAYNNEYIPINFKTEDECKKFLDSIGIESIVNGTKKVKRIK